MVSDSRSQSMMASKIPNDSKRPRLDSGLGTSRPSTSTGNDWDDDDFDKLLTQDNLKVVDDLIMNSKHPFIDAKEVPRTPKRRFSPNNFSKTSKSNADLISCEDIISDLDRSSQENGKYKKENARLQDELMKKSGEIKIKHERIESLERQIYELRSSLTCNELTQKKNNQDLELKHEDDLKKKQTEINFLLNEKQKLQQQNSNLQHRLTVLEKQIDQMRKSSDGSWSASTVATSQNANGLTQRRNKDVPPSENFPNRKSFYTGASQMSRKRRREEQTSDDLSTTTNNFVGEFSLCKAIRQCLLTEKLKEKRSKYWFVIGPDESKTEVNNKSSLKQAATRKI